MKILTVVGARPQFIKAAMVSQAILQHNEADKLPHIIEEITHTGQHYDENMSQVFFGEMGIPEPVVNLNIGGSSHGEMTGRMLLALEKESLDRQPDWVLVYGDTNSTLAGALAAAKLHLPVAHVEAGLRSFNKQMPEEINRVLTDHVSDILFCPTKNAVENLKNEGIMKGVHHVGDVMYDAAIAFGKIAREQSNILLQLNLTPKEYYLATVHRAENTNRRERLSGILQGLNQLGKERPVVLPLHPRTKKQLDVYNLTPLCSNLHLIDPVSFLDMIRLEQEARVILTDSGGVQKEAYFHGVPCVTLRDETEWVETVERGWNRLAGADPEKIAAATDAVPVGRFDEYGDGHASAKIVARLVADLRCPRSTWTGNRAVYDGAQEEEERDQ